MCFLSFSFSIFSSWSFSPECLLFIFLCLCFLFFPLSSNCTKKYNLNLPFQVSKLSLKKKPPSFLNLQQTYKVLCPTASLMALGLCEPYQLWFNRLQLNRTWFNALWMLDTASKYSKLFSSSCRIKECPTFHHFSAIVMYMKKLKLEWPKRPLFLTLLCFQWFWKVLCYRNTDKADYYS